jgi:hypothetical protein
MNCRIITTGDTQEWTELLARFRDSDVYFMAQYHQLYEVGGESTAYAFVGEEGPGVFFHPFLLRPIRKIGTQTLQGRWCDIETVVGYTGPLCTTTDPAFLRDVWNCFSTWCKEQGVIAEFIRFNPFIENYVLAPDSCTVTNDRPLVVVRLDCSADELWKRYPSIQRNMVRKAERRHLVCGEVTLVEGMRDYQRLYEETMTRVGCSFYPNSYFTFLQTYLNHVTKIFAVRDGEKIVCAGLFFVHGDRIHYHSVGSDIRYREFAPNNLLLHIVAKWGLEHGFRWLHLGGGRTASPEDSLLRFKLSISKDQLPYRLGKRIHDQDAYEALCAMWMRHKAVATRPSYFFPYRLS